MAQFVSTYQKDYTWPSEGKSRTARTSEKTGQRGICLCGADPRDRKLPTLYGNSRTNDAQEWSRLGPMGALLDPKLYPAKTGPSPESEVTKHGQPNQYLKKLEEKYPCLYGVLQKAPPAELTSAVDAHRMRTTYQTDYDDPLARSAKDRDVKLAEAKVDGPRLQLCINFAPPSSASCRPHARPPLQRETRKGRNGSNTGGCIRKPGRKPDDPEGAETKLPPPKSEYQETISRMGHSIIKGRMHHTTKKTAPAWAYIP